MGEEGIQTRIGEEVMARVRDSVATGMAEVQQTANRFELVADRLLALLDRAEVEGLDFMVSLRKGEAGLMGIGIKMMPPPPIDPVVDGGK